MTSYMFQGWHAGSGKVGEVDEWGNAGRLQSPIGLQHGDIKAAAWIWMQMLQPVSHYSNLLLLPSLPFHTHIERHSLTGLLPTDCGATLRNKKNKKCSNLSVIRSKRGEELGCFAHVKPTKLPLTMSMINIYTCPGAFTFTILHKAAAMGLEGFRRSSMRGTSETITAAFCWSRTLKKWWYVLAGWLAYANVLFTCYNPDAK